MDERPPPALHALGHTKVADMELSADQKPARKEEDIDRKHHRNALWGAISSFADRGQWLPTGAPRRFGAGAIC